MVSKSQVDAYNLQLPHGYQCQILIEEGDKSGRITIVSEFGTWSMYWGSCGGSFLTFLAGLDMEYFATKVGERKNKVSQNFKRFWDIAWIPFAEHLKSLPPQ
jgi:hypothetical protein